MKINNQELEVLKLKYKDDKLTKEQIKNRLKNIEDMDEFIKFKKKLK